jgi:nitrous oxidase accessory protein NosD
MVAVTKVVTWLRQTALGFGLALTLGLAVSVAAAQTHVAYADEPSMPPDFKVAFVADQGVRGDSVAVLELIRDEGTDMVLHQGDFDYNGEPELWDQQINNVLGSDFPYFASVGNHDCSDGVGCTGPGDWSAYQQKLEARLERIGDASCTGDLGVRSACSYKGLFFILSGAGIMGSDHDAYIRDQLTDNESTWKICSWHYNQRAMQPSNKGDSVGWGPYDECRKGGAIVATGHSHTYARTHLMDSFETHSVASASNTLQLDKGRTFAFVSGLGGQSISKQDEALAAKDWWAAVYTSDQNADFGALFCTFNENGFENRAHCYFKNINGVVVDAFDMLAGPASVRVPTDVTTIAEAIDAAAPGDIISIAAGTYAESLTVDKNLLLIGAGAGLTTIQGAGGDVVTVSAAVSLRDVTVTGGSKENDELGNGIWVTAGASLDLRNVHVVDNQKYGVGFKRTYGGPRNTVFVLNSLIESNNADGINLARTEGQILNSQLVSNSDDGIDFDGDTDVAVKGNHINGNGDDGIEIRLDQATIADIVDNVIGNNREDGIEVIDSFVSGCREQPLSCENRITIRRNSITGNMRFGVGFVDEPTEADTVGPVAIKEILCSGNDIGGNSVADISPNYAAECSQGTAQAPPASIQPSPTDLGMTMTSNLNMGNNDITFEGGKIGIGIATPVQPLHLFHTTPSVALTDSNSMPYGDYAIVRGSGCSNGAGLQFQYNHHLGGGVDDLVTICATTEGPLMTWGLATDNPLNNVGGVESSDYDDGPVAHQGLHIDGESFVGVVAIEGDAGGKLVLADSGGADDDRIMEFEVDDGVLTIRSAHDDLNSGSNVRFDSILALDMGTGNVGIGTGSFGTDSRGVLAITNGSAPTSSPADMVQLYVVDLDEGATPTTSSLLVRDEDGTSTDMSSHVFKLFVPEEDYGLPWAFYSKNAHLGYEVNVDMWGAVAAIEELSGEQFIHLQDLPESEKELWEANRPMPQWMSERIGEELSHTVNNAASYQQLVGKVAGLEHFLWNEELEDVDAKSLALRERILELEETVGSLQRRADSTTTLQWVLFGLIGLLAVVLVLRTGRRSSQTH